MTTYAQLTRREVLDLLFHSTVWHDALICHRDGSFTLRCGYYEDPTLAEMSIAALKKNTRAVILRERHVRQGLNTFIEIRFAFEAEQTD
jgi:hypothetical protein